MSKDQANPFSELNSPENSDIQNPLIPETLPVDEGLPKSHEQICKEAVPLIQKILLTTTVSSEASNCCVVLEDFDEVSISSVDILLFERILFLSNFEGDPKHIVNIPSASKVNLSVATRADPFTYLYETYMRCDNYDKHETSVAGVIQQSVCESYKTLLLQPDILSQEEPMKELKSYFLEQICYNNHFTMFIERILSLLESDNSECPKFFDQVLVDAVIRLNKCTIRNIDRQIIDMFQFYASSKYLAHLLVTLPTRPTTFGRLYQGLPLGCLLSISSIPRSEEDPCVLSSDLSPAESDRLGKLIVANLNWLRKEIHCLFLKLLKMNASMKDKLLRWIEQCITTNLRMASSWRLQQPLLENVQQSVSNGVMLNLCAVLLLLSQPITRSLSAFTNSKCKVLKVDPTYCASAAKDQKSLVGYYCAGLSDMTPIVPRFENDTAVTIPNEYSFVTACFFLCHRVLNLCVTIIEHQLKQLSRSQRHLQQEIANARPEMRERVKELLTKLSSRHIAIILAFFDEKNAAAIAAFCASTCLWMSQIAIFPHEDRRSLVPKLITSSILRQKETEENKLLCNIPEALIENVVICVNLSRGSRRDILISCSKEEVYDFFTFIACFMGAPNRISNPHLRAKMAETLCSIISQDSSKTTLLTTHAEVCLADYHLAPSLVSSLIHVFVSIEMTGSTVAFEEKFNYRRPMYDVIKIMWSLPNFRGEFVKLAKYALQHMEAAQPPLFLRFVNLLINDAIFLLDEGLAYMVQLKQQVAERENGDWDSLGAQQLSSRTRNLDHMTLLAEFHNTLASYTINTIIKISNEIPLLFAHMTLVDRIAAMLNHFLQQLVGPKRKEFKVRDMEKYKFRPADIVASICNIYFNLHQHDSFAVAVVEDGRSYNSQLFSQAITVLERTGNFQLSTDMRKVEAVVKKAGMKQKLDDDMVAPDKFIDPIMIQVMNDPVLLPSSNVIVDRATIARHLLSDQSDPFNRQPLTMDDIVPCVELKEEIKAWRKEHSDTAGKEHTDATANEHSDTTETEQ